MINNSNSYYEQTQNKVKKRPSLLVKIIMKIILFQERFLVMEMKIEKG